MSFGKARFKMRKMIEQNKHIAADNAGMTLIETMIVVVILSTLLIFAVPNMRGLHERNKLITASRQIAGLIRYARAEAITGEREIELNIDIANHEYNLDLKKYARVLGSGDRKAQKPERIEETHELPQFVFFKKVETEDDPDGREKETTLTFYPDGSATGARIILENITPRSKTPSFMSVEISRATALPDVRKLSASEMGLPVEEED